MQQSIKHTLICLAALLCYMASSAQLSGVFVPKDGQIYFHAQDSAAIFNNLTNEGKIGSAKNANIIFFGTTFRMSGPDAQLTSPSPSNTNRVDAEGGNFIFQQPNPLVGLAMQQRVVGNYNAVARSGSSFPNLTLNNPAGLVLDSSTAKVREELHLANGRIILNEQNLVVGHNNAGKISGYNPQRFVVTGTGMYGGYLIRERTDSSFGELVYPIGADAAGYTPLALTNHTNGAPLAARVSNTVYRRLFSGADLRDSTVGRTWEIARLDTGPVAIALRLQHNLETEGSQFAVGRNQSFISLSRGFQWSADGQRGAPQSPGNLTTGAALAGAGVNSGLFLMPGSGASLYATKFAFAPPGTPPPPPVPDSNRTRIVLTAARVGAMQVRTDFVTNPEVNNTFLYVQRRLGNAPNFSTIATMPTRAPGGNSNIALAYAFNDLNNPFSGLSHYRIMAISTTGLASFSNEVAVQGFQAPAANTVINVWPVPTKGRYWVGVTPEVKFFNVYAANGQLIRSVPANGRRVIEMYQGVQGVYYIGFFAADDQLIVTKKLIVQN